MKQQYKVAIGDVKFGKKTTIAIEIKGTMSDDQKLALMAFAHSDGFIQIATAQQDITDYGQQHEGIKYKLDGGEVKVDPNQLAIEDIVGDQQQKEDGWKSDENQELTDDMEQQVKRDITDEQPIMLSVEVLKAFKYLEKTRKKGEVIQIPSELAQGLVESLVVKLIPTELPF